MRVSPIPSPGPSHWQWLTLGLAMLIATHHGFSEDKETEDRLIFARGLELTGSLSGATANTLSWRSPLFTEPAELRFEALRSLRLDTAKSPSLPEESVAVTLRDGGRIYGDFVGLDADSVALRSERLGEIRLRRDQIQSLRWIRQGDLIWSGPLGTAGWTQPAKTETSVWHESRGGALTTVAWNRPSHLPMNLPEQVEVAFRVRSSGRPGFRFLLSDGKRVISVSTWDNEVVLHRGATFLSLGKLEAEQEHLVSLRLFWNRKADAGLVTTADGTPLGQWRNATASPAEQPIILDGVATVALPNASADKADALPPSRITFANRGPDLTMEFLRVRRWDGKRPKVIPRDKTPSGSRRLILSGGAVLAASSEDILGGDASTIRVRSSGTPPTDRTIAVAELEALVFDDAPFEAPTEPAANPAAVALRFNDGGAWRGDLESISEGRIRLRTAYSEGPLEADITGLTRMDFLHRDKEEEPEVAAKEKQTGKLTVGDTTVQGDWVPAPGVRLRWKLPGAVSGVPVATADPGPVDLLRPAPPEHEPPPRAAALLHLTDGQVVPGELVAIGPEGRWVELRSPLCQLDRFEAESIRAIQYPGGKIDPVRFRDRGWGVVEGTKAAQVIADEPGTSVRLRSGGAWGHANILQGNEIRFSFLSEGGGALRVRLFGPDAGREDAKSTRLLFAHFGNRVFCGVESESGNFSQRRDIDAEPGKPVPIRVTWDYQSLSVFAHGQLVVTLSADDDQSPRNGLALVFEPAGLWNNVEREVVVSEFSLKSLPGMVAAPPIGAEAKQRALIIPRFRRDDPPRQALLAWNGDLLRGAIESATAERFTFRTGMERHLIPADRAAAAIWLKPPPEEKKDSEATTPPAETTQDKPASRELRDRYTLLLRNGALLEMDVASFGPEFVTGRAGGLGECRVPAALIGSILSGDKRVPAASALFTGWQLERTPEPSPPSE